MFTEAHAAALPLAASDIATRWDVLWNFLVWLSVFFTVLICGAMFYFAIQYRRRPGLRTKYITGSHLLEVLWTAIPAALLMGVFAWGYIVYNDMTKSPADAIEVRVVGKQWLWNFQYDDGRITTNKLYAPLGKPVRLIMTSEDVLHSFFIPNMRVKSDVVPGMYTSIWFEAKIPGKHQIFCTEYCGASHSLMLSDLYVLDEQQWQAWKNGKEPDVKAIQDARELAQAGGVTKAEGKDGIRLAQAAPVRPLVEQGAQLAAQKGCNSCHNAGLDTRMAPTLHGKFGATRELADGSTVTADENYLRESILRPAAKVVKGYTGGMMPTFQGQISETEMGALIAYIKSLQSN
jgi:cytochrome c oxidase subunit 2